MDALPKPSFRKGLAWSRSVARPGSDTPADARAARGTYDTTVLWARFPSPFSIGAWLEAGASPALGVTDQHMPAKPGWEGGISWNPVESRQAKMEGRNAVQFLGIPWNPLESRHANVGWRSPASPKPNQQEQTEYPGVGKDGKHAKPGGPEPHENRSDREENNEDPARNEPGLKKKPMGALGRPHNVPGP